MTRYESPNQSFTESGSHCEGGWLAGNRERIVVKIDGVGFLLWGSRQWCH